MSNRHRDPAKARANKRAWRKKNRAHIKEYLRKYYEARPSARAALKEYHTRLFDFGDGVAKTYHQAYRLTFYGRVRCSLATSRWASKHGGYAPCTASVKELAEAFDGYCQNPDCRIAEVNLPKRLSLDHDHKTGAFRGWLCFRCNLILGYAQDSGDKLRGLIGYLHKSVVDDLWPKNRA